MWRKLLGEKKEKKSFLEGFRDKIATPERAISSIRSGDRVFIGTGCATPRVLVRALEESAPDLADVKLFHFLTNGAICRKPGVPETRFEHKVFFVGEDAREAVRQGMADYTPISMTQAAKRIHDGGFVTDVALIQTSPPDDHGFVSLGVSVDIVMAAVSRARSVIAEVNPNMPRTHGDTCVSINDIDRLVPVDEPLIEYTRPPVDETGEKIARYAARIIEDGSTLQIGMGRIPSDILTHLSNRRDLGIHSDVITDPVADLIDKGVITGEAKSIHKGKVVASYCMGTSRLYKLIDRNPMFLFHPIEYVCDPSIIAANSKFVSVTQAFAVDLTGQVCADQFEGEFCSGVSTQSDFLRGAAASKGGRPIICLPATTGDGKHSRIRPLLREGEGVAVSRADVHYIITEYGSAYLFGKSIRERALALIEIAHPDFRPNLLEEAKRLGYIRRDQCMRSRVAYPEESVSEVRLKNGLKIRLRPSRASDVDGIKDIFYRLPPRDIYTRFFTGLTSLSVSRAEHLCCVDYENEMAFIAVIENEGAERVVGSSCYVLDPSTSLAEVAYMIPPEFQGVGLGSALQRKMMEYATAHGVRGFKADILPENKKMLRLAQSGVDAEVKRMGDMYEVITLFKH